ncbi:MAG: type I-E CRISPR-associated endonuclease Cas1 [Bryobacteraceae bacterium]|nr:type I-E CRISPR-associated endonuclease Cas1 [Bryobacteraceae bacterium]
MKPRDLHILPRVEDGWSFLYVHHCRIEQDGKSISVWEESGRTPVPCASISLLMLGPGATITHAAVRALADSGCLIQWVGEEGVRVYGVGLGETRSSRNLLRQAAAWANPQSRLTVVRRMYALRFQEPVDESFSLQQLRGREGIRVRTTYAEASRQTGVEWKGRDYNRTDWKSADPINRALSCANSCLYGICHSAIVAAGYSPAIGFVHTGKALSFVYDVADLYKTTTTIPAAFAAAKAAPDNLESSVRHAMRDMFFDERLLEKILPDLATLFAGLGEGADSSLDSLLDSDDALPSGLWDPVAGKVEGGVNYSENPDDRDDSGTRSPQPEG